MELYVRDSAREFIGIIDVYESVIWTKRYNTAGDFEIYAPVTPEIIRLINDGCYLTRLDDDMCTIIDHFNITTDAEDGAYITITGPSAESLLNRRIVWNQTNLKGRVEDCVRQLITENVINPTMPERKINGFVLGPLQGFSETMEKQITGDNLLESVSKICNTYGMGFKITLGETNNFVFSLYKGEDRSYSQQKNPYVVFSPNFDNLLNSEYDKDYTNYKNVALVAGEGEGASRKTRSVGNVFGINRRETYVDARDLSSTLDNNVQMTAAEYNAVLDGRGAEALSETNYTEAYRGEVEPSTTYVYKQDYFVGDIIQIENEYGITASPRIVEMIESDDESGYKTTPGFATMEV